MNRRSRNHLRLVALATGICLAAAPAPALADAWGMSWGRVDGFVNPLGPYDRLEWNTDPNDWLLYAEAEVHHYHPGHTWNYALDLEDWNDPTGDGIVNVGPVYTGCLASVEWVRARIAATGGPFVDINSLEDVYSYAHDIPNSSSDAAGLGQHDNPFWIEWDGVGNPPDSAWATVALTGKWFLEGGSDPDDNWWADWFTYGEVYGPDPHSPDPTNPDLIIYEVGSEYHQLHGPGYKYGEGLVHLERDIEVLYDTPYSFRFWVDAESHAEAVPEPATGLLLACGLLTLLRRRARHAAAE